MVSDFFATTADDWTDPTGQLHAYLVPDAATRERLARAVAAVAHLGYLAPQPIDGLHATVQRFPFLIGELDEATLTQLQESAAASAAGLSPVRLGFGEVVPTVNSVLTLATPDDQWAAVVDLARTAAAAALGDAALHYQPPFGPHITIAYATGEGADSDVVAALADAGADGPAGEIVFTELAWCAVHQNKAEGTYTFETLFATPLAG